MMTTTILKKRGEKKVPKNEDIEWDEYKVELLSQIEEDRGLCEALLKAVYWDDYRAVKNRLEVLEQDAINAVLQSRRDYYDL